MRRIYQSGDHLGDVAVLKVTLFSNGDAPGPYTEKILARRAENFTRIDLDQLAALPPGSFGHEYSRFMRRNGLRPFNFSDRVAALFDTFPVSTRYVRIHDMVHVLLGFEPDIPGELGVYAFVGEQHYNPTLDRAALTARFFAAFMFWSRSKMRAARLRGKALARGARILIAEPLEDMLERPLAEVRRELGLAADS